MMRTFLLPVFLAVLAGCGLQIREADRPATPRENAAAHLTQQGSQLLSAGRPDQAMHLFEQAVGLDPANGQCYYFMAEAMAAKGKFQEAKQFNNMALDLLKKNAEWEERARRQTGQIEDLANRRKR